MSHTHLLPICGAALALAFPGSALAVGGNYVLSGGTAYERQQVVDALEVSSFDWSVVPQQISVVIEPTPSAEATPGTIYLDPSLLDSGEFSWGVVQHEYAHQVDFELLNDGDRAELDAALGGSVWWPDEAPGLRHSQYGCERFASTLAWAFWPSARNSMRPADIGVESAGMAPGPFRALLAGMLGQRAAPAVAVAETVHAPRVGHPQKR